MTTQRKQAAQHTPGPWRTNLKYDRDSDGIVVTCQSDGMTYHAAIIPSFGLPFNPTSQADLDAYGPSHEQCANARLIALAPEMAEALAALVFEASHAIHDPNRGTAILANELRNARAILARINGEGGGV